MQPSLAATEELVRILTAKDSKGNPMISRSVLEDSSEICLDGKVGLLGIHRTGDKARKIILRSGNQLNDDRGVPG